MAEENTPKRIEPQQTDGDSDTPPLVVPSHDPLPLPPVIEFTGPNLDRRSSHPSPGASVPPDTQGPSGHGAGLAAGFTFVASVLAGLVAGLWLDAHFNHSRTPWWTMIMAVAGMGVGFTNMFKLLSRGNRRKP